MLSLLAISALVCLASAFVCPPNYCDHVKQPELNCTGSVIPHTGLCGCYNSCARLEGETCISTHVFGTLRTAVCDTGLVCALTTINGDFEMHKCVKAADVQTTPSQPVEKEVPGEVKRQTYQCGTPCRRKSVHCAISMIVYAGQWFAKCDAAGNFLPEQCDNTGHCFCVDTATGAVLDGTKVLGSASC
ncbi:hypothetical protein BsWGS_08079 [Bradybaena similaris]